MTSKTKGFLLALDLVILATGFAMLLPPLPAVGLFIIVGGVICGALAWRRRKALPPCINCGESFDALEADWCSCLTRHRTLVCTNCLMCFCKAPEAYKERFWTAAPPKEPEAPPEPLPDVVARPLVMLVESDPRIAATVQRVCRNLGYGIVTAPGPRPHAPRDVRPLDHGADQRPAEAFRGGCRMMSVQRSAVALLLVATFAAHAQTSADALQRAAEGNDYRAFREALDGAKDPKPVYRDIDAVWSYAQSSPTGAFFDDKSELMSIVRKYPGYAKAIADVTLTAGGRTLYPTRETRLFLAKQSRAAVPAAGTPASRRPPVVTPPPAVEKPAPVPVPQPAPPAVETTDSRPARTPARPAPALPVAAAAQPEHIANLIVAIILVIVGVGLAVLLFRASDS